MKKNYKAGFSLIEMVVTIGLLATFLGFITYNLLHTQRSASLSSTFETMVSDFRSQQVKAMVGDTEGRTDPDSYGIHFDGGSYTLFHGTSYNSSDASNYTVTLDSQLAFSPTNKTIIFTRMTGEVTSFVSNQNTITLGNTFSGDQKTMTFNKYGVPTDLN